MIDVQGLTKVYARARGDGAKALDGVTFTVPDESVFGFLGPNGAGKTTTIRILATILEPTEGTATVEGHDIRTEPLAVKVAIGYMPENPGYYPTMTAEQHLDYWGQFYRMAREERRTRGRELLDLVGLGDERTKKVRAYSHGMLKRLGLAQALLHDPPVLILDEPAGGLDPYGIIFFRNLMKELNRQGKTILLSSHILSEVAQTCTHVGVINRGRIVAVNTTAGLESRIGGGGVRCLVEAPTVPDSALRGLLEISHVKDVQRTDWGLIVTMDKDARAAVNAFLVGLGVPVMGVKLAEVTLEDAFLALTRGGSS
ncbi:MAG TPA: ABC transporter ATP-binding protein [Thermoplasmata archaeon]|nr:ABC transporter ATP-binding protein [Thermoplasmata archaeon]